MGDASASSTGLLLQAIQYTTEDVILLKISSVILPSANPLMRTKGCISGFENRYLNLLVAPTFLRMLPRWASLNSFRCWANEGIS